MQPPPLTSPPGLGCCRALAEGQRKGEVEPQEPLLVPWTERAPGTLRGCDGQRMLRAGSSAAGAEADAAARACNRSGRFLSVLFVLISCYSDEKKYLQRKK